MMSNSSYTAPVSELLEDDVDRIVGLLVSGVAGTGITSQYSRQITVWKEQIALLRDGFRRLIVEGVESVEDWHVALEYEIPRRQKRPDAILLANDRVIVIEFKFEMQRYEAAAKWQIDDYAFNLRDFHAESHGRFIVPILCAVDAPAQTVPLPFANESIIAPIQFANGKNLWKILQRAYGGNLPPTASSHSIDSAAWITSPYRPTLTIIEAAERLYGGHSVREISHNYAENLNRTTDMLAAVILDAKQYKKRVICFVTGVPGAGKTLTGLNVVHDPSIRSRQGPSGIFLSGNGPLIKVVQKALLINQQCSGHRREEAKREISAFIKNVHQFLRHYREHHAEVPYENVVVFDEAQRAWNQEQMQRKQGVGISESAELLSVMERLPNWSVIVALVGGGQEIFLGEAGLEAWGKAVVEAQERWTIVASPEVVQGGESVAGHRLFSDAPPTTLDIRHEPLAHLSVNVRSHRAQQITQWVNEVIAYNPAGAQVHFPDSREFPLVMTRDLETAREWLRVRSGCDPATRCGLVATSGDQRFRAYGLENSTGFRGDFSFENWFLSPREDVRSSYMLEVPATEFECQGLELDWVGVCWGGDLTPSADRTGWDYRKFRGSGWQNCHSGIEQAYIRNRYRVLLTRARAGTVIWVPPGSSSDSTRKPSRFERIYDFLKSAGVVDLAILE